MANIELVKVEKKFGDFHAVKPMDLTIKDGEFVVLLGPSGCGKTTTLRMIAGLETVTSGKILLNGADITHQPARERDIAFVFQFFALYPHMTARENIAFPLQAQRVPKDIIAKRVKEVTKLLEIEYLLHLRPGVLSSGDQQRVALARALVRKPQAFLMDEPLGALDAEFRETMRAEIKKLHIRERATTLYVTHDQIEAMAMGDKIVVMSAAVIQQVGTPAEVYHNPANTFVAKFIGSPGMNLLPGIVQSDKIILPNGDSYLIPQQWKPVLMNGWNGKKVYIGFRPEALIIDKQGCINATVYGEDMHGSNVMLNMGIKETQEVVHGRVERGVYYAIDAPICFNIREDMVRFFDAETGNALKAEVKL